MLPIIVIGVAAVTGLIGVGNGANAIFDKIDTSKLNDNAREALEKTTNYVDRERELCKNAIINLGELKNNILEGNINHFLNAFNQIKNVDLSECENLNDINKCHLDNADFETLKNDVNLLAPAVGGFVAGGAAGAAIAFGAYGAAGAFATASTGTAIASLSGAAASNATLAFFGGGAISSGGLGMAGGAAVLGSIAFAPALFVMGTIAGISAQKDLENAHINQENVKQTIEELSVACLRCSQIRRKAYIMQNLLAKLDAKLLPLIFKMEDIIKDEGDDYRNYSIESKKVIASAASIAISIKTVLDTPLLNEDGELVEENKEENA